MKKFLLVVFIMGAFLTSIAWAQGPTAVIQVESFSPFEVDTTNIPTVSSGLKVVGKGQIVYLSGHNSEDEEVTTYTWALETLPDGSQATLDSTDKMMTTLVPDTLGQFVVKLTIATASGQDDTTITITSAYWVGAGGVGGIPADVSAGQCQLCHSGNHTSWQETGHATFFEEAIDGAKSSHYNEDCIKCHTVGYDTLATAVNMGFDDIASDTGWVFPDTLKEGNWDSLVANYPELAKRANIQCENCHGAGSLHKGNPAFIDLSLDEGVCGQCHDDGSHHIKNEQWMTSAHAEGVGFAANRSFCADCHSGYGYIERTSNPDYLDITTGSPQTSCAVCHDPHSNENNDHQLRTTEDVTLFNNEVVSFGEKGKLCMSCHHSIHDAKTYATTWVEHFGPHHGPQADMLAGTNAVTFGMDIPSSTHKNVVKDVCVTCHMAQTPAEGQPAHNLVGEHTFAMHTEVNGQEVDNVAACQTCHGSVTSFEDFMAKADYDNDGTRESAQDEIRGLLDEVAMRLPPIGEPTLALLENETTDPNYTTVQLQAAYNYLFVEEDHSFGVHNYQYALNLLQTSIKALDAGEVGAGMISNIKDVPNDQGKQVRVTWTKFTADGVSSNPINFYSLWRRVDGMAKTSLQKSVPVYESFADAVSNGLTEGTRVLINDEMWDFAGEVPAADMTQYSAIAPTVFDSTKTDGMHWSVFVVAGHTDIPANTVESAPDSGYSVDNLSPMAPANVSAKEVASKAVLSWDDPVDEDFNYFVVYRSTSAGFEPGEPFTTTSNPTFTDTDVQVNTNYYYRISAIDFSGNESELSNEVSLLITSVVDVSSVPDAFVLEQNYPNPFNPSTDIAFGLPEAGHVTLTIYNTLGEKVRTLVDRDYGVGYYKLTWDGRDDMGHSAGPGMYFYKLQNESVTMIKKMILLK